MTSKQKMKVEELIIGHIKGGGTLHRVSSEIASKAGVSQPEVESSMRGLFNQHVLAFDGEGNILLVGEPEDEGGRVQLVDSYERTRNGKSKRQVA